MGKGKLVVVVDFKLGGLAACGFERGTQAGKRRVALHQVRPSCRLLEIDDVIDPFGLCACEGGHGAAGKRGDFPIAAVIAQQAGELCTGGAAYAND